MERLDYLESHLTDHCNLNCAGCGHFAPLQRPSFADVEVFRRDIVQMATLFDDIGRLRLIGGEPLLHPEVLSFAETARRAFPAAAISLVTNGLLLPSRPEAFWRRLADLDVRVDVSRYPVSLDLRAIEREARRHGTPLIIRDVREEFFRMPLLRHPTADARTSFSRCRSLFACPNLRDGRLYACPVVPLSRAFAQEAGWVAELAPTGLDSVDIYSATAAQIREFLDRPIPWCAHCDAEALTFRPWQPSDHSLAEWTDPVPLSV